jgi:glyoxylase-like metal-dependent hydrolase (beta-lactamase superfamily II)
MSKFMQGLHDKILLSFRNQRDINMKKFLAVITLLLLGHLSISNAQQDLQLLKVVDNVWSIIGPLTNRTPENLGNNATFGFVVTDDGVVLIDSGGSYHGAQKIHELIKDVTDKPIRYVINSGGQDHRWFGNDYFSRLGATIISSRDTWEDQKKRVQMQTNRMIQLIGEEAFRNTWEKEADEVFDFEKTLEVGGVKFELVHIGQAHTPGDTYVWLPQQSVMFTGDIVYIERLLGVMDHSNSKSWIEVFDDMASHEPKNIIPGHGHPTVLERAKKETRGYLVALRERVAAFMDEGGDASDISQVDMSDYSYLFNFDTLNGRNMLQVYTELEWE